MDASPSITDWIIAIASVFAAVGTVGAVIVALWQILHQGARSLVVKCTGAVIGDTPAVHALALRGTNDGSRPINLTMAYLMTKDGQQIISPFLRYSDQLPKVLSEGESVDVFWSQDNLAQVKDNESVEYLYAFFMDVLGNVYKAPYPGVVMKRKGLRRREVFALSEGTQTEQ
jgi:hypothetical protein